MAPSRHRLLPGIRVDAYHEGMANRDKPLLEAGNEDRWAEINREESRQEAEFAASLSVAERLEFGQKLSQQAVSLLAASIRAGNVPERAFWS